MQLIPRLRSGTVLRSSSGILCRKPVTVDVVTQSLWVFYSCFPAFSNPQQEYNYYSRFTDANKSDQLLLIASCILDFECIHPFMDGNGRIGRLLTLYLLYMAGYEVGRYISLERIVEESKESYYEALNKSSQKWHEGEHDLRPWWNYFIGMLTAAYKEFEERVGKITNARGAKREMVMNAIKRLTGRFTIADLRRACPAVSYPTLQRALFELRNKKVIRCLGRGPDAEWEKI